jgi:ribosomal protein S18 acetylase RimI-like enzyme
LEIAHLHHAAPAVSALADLLIETVGAGGSVSFMHPLDRATAEAFWDSSLTAADEGSRAVIGAFDQGELVGTVTVLLNCPPNQPHRAEIAKLMVPVNHRNCGIAKSLMAAAERTAISRGKTLLTLDTAEEDGAAVFYERLGFQRAGLIPDYALKPRGGLTATIFYWKRIGTAR